MSEYPNIEAIAHGTIAGHFRDWPKVRPEAQALLAEVESLRAERDAAQQRAKWLERQLAEAEQATMDAEKRVDRQADLAEWLQDALREFQRTRGKHDGEHDAAGGTNCSRCVAAYNAAEAALDAALAPSVPEEALDQAFVAHDAEITRLHKMLQGAWALLPPEDGERLGIADEMRNCERFDCKAQSAFKHSAPEPAPEETMFSWTCPFCYTELSGTFDGPDGEPCEGRFWSVCRHHLDRDCPSSTEPAPAPTVIPAENEDLWRTRGGEGY